MGLKFKTRTKKGEGAGAKCHEIIYVLVTVVTMELFILRPMLSIHEGLVTPHIAAGIIFNFLAIRLFTFKPSLFLTRSFAVNKLYYRGIQRIPEACYNKGYSVKYYPEGGRSRTGRLTATKQVCSPFDCTRLIKGINRPVKHVTGVYWLRACHGSL